MTHHRPPPTSQTPPTPLIDRCAARVGCHHGRVVTGAQQPTGGRRPPTSTRRRPHAAHNGSDAILDQDDAAILTRGGA